MVRWLVSKLLKSSKQKKELVALVRERSIPSERPSLVGGVSANFLGYRVSRGQRNGSLRLYSRISRPQPLLFLPVTPQLYSCGSAGNRTRTSESVAKNSGH
jgi:hypothetical protein